MDKGMISMSIMLIAAALFFITIACAIIVIIDETRAYNDGFCIYCETQLRNFDKDEQGERGYCCDNCGHHVWISWKIVDRKHVDPPDKQKDDAIEAEKIIDDFYYDDEDNEDELKKLDEIEITFY